jgi:O-antigen chain-terminating methyltransferase
MGSIENVQKQISGVQKQISGKVDKEPFWKLSKQIVDKDTFWKTVNQKVDKDVFETEKERAAQEYGQALNGKLDKEVFDAEKERTTQEYWQALNGKVDKQLYFKGNDQITDALTAIRSTHQELFVRIHEQKVTVLDQQRRLALLLEEARKRMPKPFEQDQVAAMADAADHWLDAHYLSFEDVFRGTRDDIKERVEVYLPLIRSVNAGTEERPLLDLGCGRGELLEVLKENGLSGRGIDQNQILIQQCAEAGLEVVEADAIEYLAALPAASVGAITGLHIIEHIPFARLVRLLDESLRVLKPGGAVAFETPNPENLLVGACNFYYDPTHLHPLPPPVSQFLLEARGFTKVEIKRLTENRTVETLPLAPLDEPDSEHLNQVVDFINGHFGAAPDYAVIAYKA